MNRRELAHAMRNGIERPEVFEDRTHFISIGALDDHCFVCALGAAAVGLHNGDFKKAYADYIKRHTKSVETDTTIETSRVRSVKVLSEMLGLDFDLAADVSYAHEIERVPINEIASWLESSEQRE